MTLLSPPPDEMAGMSAPSIDIFDLTDGDDDEQFFTPITDRGKTKTTPISVEDYAEDRDLNLAILASLQTAAGIDGNSDFIDLSRFDDDVTLLDFATPSFIHPPPSPSSSRRKRVCKSTTETGQSSNSNPSQPDPEPEPDSEFLCEICAETRTKDLSFPIKGCSHAYCKQCMAKYVASKLQDNLSSINCPVSGCDGFLEPEYCRSILPHEVFDRWGKALCEALILGAHKFYCPFKDCSAMLVDDGSEVVTQAECPYCCRLFCARCRVPWHSEIDCNKFQRLHKDERGREDIMLINLAGKNLWRRCPNCKFYVERTHGCRYIKCRCGTAFCYGCGGIQISAASHVCPKCG
ncbi:E3 ubiquitin-protein ligase RSL1 [Linum perenne]